MEAQRTVSPSPSQPWLAYMQVQEAIDALYRIVWDRWHPLNPATRGGAPKDVYDALEDLRPLALEIHGLWERLGVTLDCEGRS